MKNRDEEAHRTPPPLPLESGKFAELSLALQTKLFPVEYISGLYFVLSLCNIVLGTSFFILLIG
jgi:hypothetical protein